MAMNGLTGRSLIHDAVATSSAASSNVDALTFGGEYEIITTGVDGAKRLKARQLVAGGEDVDITGDISSLNEFKTNVTLGGVGCTAPDYCLSQAYAQNFLCRNVITRTIQANPYGGAVESTAPLFYHSGVSITATTPDNRLVDKKYVDSRVDQLPGPAAKVDLGVSDPSYSGDVVAYIVKPSETVLRGQPVYAEFADSGITVVKTLTAAMTAAGPTSQFYIGIALRTVTGNGILTVDVMTSGYTTCRTTSTYPANTYPDRTFRYTDSGDVTGVYSSNENFTKNTFDAGVGGTWDMVIDGLPSYGFETLSTIYDYLQLRVSNDGVNFVNFSSPYLYDQVVSKSTRVGGGSYFPLTESELVALGYDIGMLGIPINYRFAQFIFKSDTSGNFNGWSLELTSSNSVATAAPITADVKMGGNGGVVFTPAGLAANPFVVGDYVYQDGVAFDKVTTTPGSDIIGTIAAADGANDSVFTWVRKL